MPKISNAMRCPWLRGGLLRGALFIVGPIWDTIGKSQRVRRKMRAAFRTEDVDEAMAARFARRAGVVPRHERPGGDARREAGRSAHPPAAVEPVDRFPARPVHRRC